MFKNVLISVSNKDGLLEFLNKIKPNRIVSTGGTAKYLREGGFHVVDVSEQTKFPEIMGGRVKTLHPRIHMALLNRLNFKEDEDVLKQENVEPFDLLICNLYPFEKSVNEGLQGNALIEKIDIGGPSMLRSAAKNFVQLTVLCDPKDYSWVSERVSLDIEDRKKLAAKVFAHTAAYDTLIAEKLGAGEASEFTLAGNKVMELRYGENPQQQANWYQLKGASSGIHEAKILQGKTLSYNNLLDLDAAGSLVSSFTEAAAVAVKHNNPCGVAIDQNFTSAVAKALAADSTSVFGGVIAVNRKITEAEAELLSSLFLECLIAPEYSSGALQIFEKKKNFRVLEWKNIAIQKARRDFRSIEGGFLIQNFDFFQSNPEKWKWIGKQAPEEIMKDLLFAEKVCASLKSNAIAFVRKGQTVGLGMGQVNRVDAVAQAIERMQNNFKNIDANKDNVVMASDAFFPFPDSIEKAAQSGVRWIVQPGGSIKDEDVFKVSEKLGIGMAITGTRHFRH